MDAAIRVHDGNHLATPGLVHFKSFDIADRSVLLQFIKSCETHKDLNKAAQAHVAAVRNRLFPYDICVSNALLNMYIKCGDLTEAVHVFKGIPVPNIISWNTLISGYAQYGFSYEALKCFRRMQDEGVYPDSVAYVCVLKACASVEFLEIGRIMHGDISKRGLLRKNIVLGTALVNMYAKCGSMEEAHKVFDVLPVRNIISWSTLIANYVQHGFGDTALKCYMQMQEEGIFPDVITYVCILKACGITRCLEIGEKVHAEITMQGMLCSNFILSTALIDMYAKCNMIEKAQLVFSALPERNIASWTVLITGYAHLGFYDEALNKFRMMQYEGLSPCRVTLISVLKSCGKLRYFSIADEVYSQGLFEDDDMLATTLVDTYAKCNMLGKAREIFDKISRKDVISWSALIDGYAQHGHSDEALNCYRKMQGEGVSPNAITFISMLGACGSSGHVEMGQEIHAKVIEHGFLEIDVVLQTTLIDMYAKCGLLGKAQKVFQEYPTKNVECWNALIGGYAHMGQAVMVVDLVIRMISEGTMPDVVTFLSLLHAYNHAGLVEEAQIVFNNMISAYSFSPTVEHFTCMVSLFSRAALFWRAIGVVEQVPSTHHLSLWLAILAASAECVNVKVGFLAFEQSIQLDMNCTAAYIYMGNIYASAGMAS